MSPVACHFLPPLLPALASCQWLPKGGISRILTQAIWQPFLHPGLPESWGDPACVQPAFGKCWSYLDFPDLLLLLEDLQQGAPTVPSTPITKPWGMQAHFPGPLWCVVGKLNGTGDKVPLSLQGDLCESDKGRIKPVVWLGVYARQREIAIWYAP